MQQIRIDPLLRARIARARPLTDRRQTHLRYQPPRPTATNIPTIAPQMPRHLAAAIPRTLHEGLIDHRHQRQRQAAPDGFQSTLALKSAL
jgi:hypothetical protein